jgi:amidase
MTQQRIHAFRDDALGEHDAVSLANLLRKGEVSPAELTAAAIARAQSVNPHLHGVEHPDYERAQQNANDPKAGFFAGIPTFIKDNIAVQGLPTNHGSAAIRSQPARAHGVYTKQYLSSGLHVLGKSTMPEFGFNATTEPEHCQPTRNPWHTDYSTGASSGGSAALVAAGVVPIAHANDGGGSIRIPAACCGLVGLKPSRGRHIDAEQNQKLPVRIVSEGVVTRSVRDTAYFHAELEKYYRNPKLPPIGLVTEPNKRRLKIALVIDSVTGHPTDPETRQTVENTAKLLADMGHQIMPVAIPITPSFIEDFVLYWSLLAFAMQRAGRWTADPSFNSALIDGLTKGLAKNYTRKFYKTPLSIYRLHKTYQDYQDFMPDYDAVLTPVLAHTTAPLGYIKPTVDFDELLARLCRYVSFTPLANTSGAPAISLPRSITHNGLPISVQFSGRHGDEKTLLELAYELEQADRWRHINQQ